MGGPSLENSGESVSLQESSSSISPALNVKAELEELQKIIIDDSGKYQLKQGSVDFSI